jgi:hypothetical protein
MGSGPPSTTPRSAQVTDPIEELRKLIDTDRHALPNPNYLGMQSRLNEIERELSTLRDSNRALANLHDDVNGYRANLHEQLLQLPWKWLQQIANTEAAGGGGLGGEFQPEFPATDALVLLRAIARRVGLTALDTGENVRETYTVHLRYTTTVMIEHDRDFDASSQEVRDTAIQRALLLLEIEAWPNTAEVTVNTDHPF